MLFFQTTITPQLWSQWSAIVHAKEVGYDVGMMQYHMTLECSLERVWGVVFLVTRVYPVMTWMSRAWCSVLSYYWCFRVFAKLIQKCSGDEKDGRTSTDFFTKGGRLGYSARHFFFFAYVSTYSSIGKGFCNERHTHFWAHDMIIPIVHVVDTTGRGYTVVLHG